MTVKLRGGQRDGEIRESPGPPLPLILFVEVTYPGVMSFVPIRERYRLTDEIDGELPIFEYDGLTPNIILGR